MKINHIFILLICVIILMIVLYTKSKQIEGFESQIPLVVYITWHTKELPPFMNQNVEKLKQDNPEFSVQLFDDKDCRDFIQANFDTDVLNAYDTLIPGAYKADLWRYCVLYKNGGVYMDIKMKFVDGFKLIELIDKEQYVNERIPNAYLNALIVAEKNSEYMKKCIDKVVENVKNRYYGSSPLDPTGPVLMYNVAKENELHPNITMQHFDGYITNIASGKLIIKTNYDEYRTEQKLFQKTGHYDKMWRDTQIYK